MCNTAKNLFQIWREAKSLEPTRGWLPRDIVMPDDNLFSIKLTSLKDKALSSVMTRCSRCARIQIDRQGNSTSFDFGFSVECHPLDGDSCEECGVALAELESFNELVIMELKQWVTR